MAETPKFVIIGEVHPSARVKLLQNERKVKMKLKEEKGRIPRYVFDINADDGETKKNLKIVIGIIKEEVTKLTDNHIVKLFIESGANTEGLEAYANFRETGNIKQLKNANEQEEYEKTKKNNRTHTNYF